MVFLPPGHPSWLSDLAGGGQLQSCRKRCTATVQGDNVGHAHTLNNVGAVIIVRLALNCARLYEYRVTGQCTRLVTEKGFLLHFITFYILLPS